MPVHSAGPRLYHSVHFKHLVKKHGSAGGAGRATNIALNLTPFVDMMTILVTFLLMVTKSEITYQGQLVATTESVLRDDSPTFKIDALYERLDAAAKKIKEDVGLGRLPKDLAKACEDAKQGIVTPGKICPDGLAILQADESTDVRLINKIVN